MNVRVGDLFERTSKKGFGQRIKVVSIQAGVNGDELVNPLVNVRNTVTDRVTVMYLKRLQGPRFKLVSRGRT